jgi:hypothetical protein
MRGSVAVSRVTAKCEAGQALLVDERRVRSFEAWWSSKLGNPRVVWIEPARFSELGEMRIFGLGLGLGLGEGGPALLRGLEPSLLLLSIGRTPGPLLRELSARVAAAVAHVHDDAAV